MQKQKTYIVCAIIALTLTVFSIDAYAQIVHIPDPNLGAAIRETLKLAPGAPITQGDMRRLTRLTADNRGIIDLSGLETATNLETLSLGENPLDNLSPLAHLTALRTLILRGCQINDISPLSSLTRLETLLMHNNRIHDISALAGYTRLKELNARNNSISDLSALAHLTTLEHLDLSRCLIVDISPLSHLVNLKVLQLNRNRIVDVRPISTLASLYKLEIDHNHITDHSPLDSLSLDIFYYDQICEMPPLPLQPRLTNRTFPSIFAKWSNIGEPPIYTNRPNISGAQNLALHDLRFSVKVFGLRFIERNNEFTVSGDLDDAIRQRDQLLALNPNMIHLVDVGMRAAPLSFFPEDWPGWIRDENGNIFRKVEDDGTLDTAGLLDFTLPIVQDLVVNQAIAVSKCGLYDGIFFDYWAEDSVVLRGWDGKQNLKFRTLEEELQARDIIVKRIRANTRPNFLIMGNTNDGTIPRTAPYINGGFMETVLPYLQVGVEQEASLNRVKNALKWMDTNLREPQINALEGSAIPSQPPDSPDNLRWVRVITTLSLTNSDGYITFIVRHSSGGLWSDGVWYDFWDADLGRPVGEKSQLYAPDISGLYIREFTNGWAVYNHSGSEQNIRLPELATGVASGLEGTTHTLPDVDGEIYLRVKPKNPADVNGDGVVNVLDLVVVAQGFGTDSLEGDVNGDGVVNVFDLVFVANQL